MKLSQWIEVALREGASDLHLEAGLAPMIRVRGTLRGLEEPVESQVLREIAQELVGPEQWPDFLTRKSADLSRTIAGVRCRMNLFQTARGLGLAVRLLPNNQLTVERLNLHPDLKKLVTHVNGLVLVTGPTGSGKSSTLAALLEEVNLSEPSHVITVESPIEFHFRPRRAFIRQREVGRDTPSFEQALLDALREDPDVLMVGEMRDPETMRLTLNAAETGHLVLTTMHSATCAEALQRFVAAFPPEIQSNVAAQLADCLVAVVAQRLRYRSDLNLRVPECEVLVSSHAAKRFIREREFHKLTQTLETGADAGMWTFVRYQTWLQRKTTWHRPESPAPQEEEAPVTDPASPAISHRPAAKPAAAPHPKPTAAQHPSGWIEIEPLEGGLNELFKRMDPGAPPTQTP